MLSVKVKASEPKIYWIMPFQYWNTRVKMTSSQTRPKRFHVLWPGRRVCIPTPISLKRLSTQFNDNSRLTSASNLWQLSFPQVRLPKQSWSPPQSPCGSINQSKSSKSCVMQPLRYDMGIPLCNSVGLCLSEDISSLLLLWSIMLLLLT